MTRTAWSRLTLGLLLFLLISIVCSVVIIDPFEIYHEALFYIPPIDNGTQNYSNAGIAKSYDYDSVVIGSSMTENFSTKLLDAQLGGSFVKLPINGGSPFNHKQMMDLAFSTHDVQRILYGVDVEALTYFYKTPKCEMPEYLYDDNLLNDTQYWFNMSVLGKFLPRCLATLGQSDPDLRDTMYNWGDLYDYGREAALRGIRINGKTIPQKEQAPVLSQQSRLNVEHNYLPYIESHPETEFLFFFPPYSAAMWYRFYTLGDLDYHLAQKEALTEILLQYDNVKVFDFQARTDWILDLNNYIDASHYGPWINDAMTMHIARDEYRVTDTAVISANNDVIRALVGDIVACGAWPDAFPSAVTD
ncbi:MAG: hypothetical protein J6K32_03900 [Clostridia bacterium]|nr:hypothetical protein [Clostridia bacterium]